MSQTSTIEVSNLKKAYGDVWAVRGVSFKVDRGEIVGFLGPNGAGKSTVMKILTCYMAATSGTASVAGHNVYRDSLAVRRSVGYQPENVPLYDEMVVYDYLLFMAKMRGVRRSDRVDRIDEVAKTCGLREVMGRLIRELSKGFRQRVGLAQALIHDPPVLILDEPMSGLDPNQIVEIRDLIKAIGKKKTVIFSSHILQEIERICDRVLIIDRGRIVADGSVSELTEYLEGQRRYEVTISAQEDEAADITKKLEELDVGVDRLMSETKDAKTLKLGLKSSQGIDLRPLVYELANKNDWALLELRETALSLEDVFKALTGEQP